MNATLHKAHSSSNKHTPALPLALVENGCLKTSRPSLGNVSTSLLTGWRAEDLVLTASKEVSWIPGRDIAWAGQGTNMSLFGLPEHHLEALEWFLPFLGMQLDILSTGSSLDIPQFWKQHWWDVSWSKTLKAQPQLWRYKCWARVHSWVNFTGKIPIPWVCMYRPNSARPRGMTDCD